MPVQISLRNLTASDLTIADMGLILDASADMDLTSTFTTDGVRFSNNLNTAIQNDQILIIENGNLYTKTQSLIFMSGGGLVSENLTILGAGTVIIASGTNTITVSGASGAIVAASGVTVTSGIGFTTIDAPYNFSFETVTPSITIQVPDNQQMIVDGVLDLQSSGILQVNGTLVVQNPARQAAQIQQNLDTLAANVVLSLNTLVGALTLSAGTGIGISTQGTTITISGTNSASSPQSFQFYADQFNTPLEADWAVNAFAPLNPDTTNSGIMVRPFDDTTEEGVGFSLEVPSTASTITLKLRSRAETAPGATRTVGLKMYVRSIPDNGAITSWLSTVLTDLSFPTNTNFQYDSQLLTIGALNVTAGVVNQFELTRINPTAGTELSGDWDLMLLNVELG